MYRPLAYTTQVKHPGKRYFLRAVLQEDGMFWLLATAWSTGAPIWHALALLPLLVSFWCIYERGYVENDLIALEREGDQGMVPRNLDPDPPHEVWPWLWALALGGAGTGVMAWSGALPSATGDWWSATTAWFVMLAVMRGVFLAYNHLRPRRRIWLYPLLQAGRSFAVLSVAAINAVGVMILVAHMLARTIPYFVYRLARRQRGDWPDLNVFTMRLGLFAILLAALATYSPGPERWLDWQALAILGWCAFRARREIGRLLAQFRSH